MDINDIRKHFKWFETNKGLVYADTAATSLKPDCVSEAVVEYYQNQSTNPHNTDSNFTNVAHNKMQECRQKVAQLINADEDEIIFTSGATESLNLIAQSLIKTLKRGDEVILTNYEHTSNLLPWYNLRDKIGIKIVFVKNKEPKLKDFINLINVKTKVVSFTGVSNLVGYRFDVNLITKTIRDYKPDVFICVDAAQMIAHYPCDVKAWDCDFLAFSGHKIFGPTGIGVAYIKKELQPKIIPYRFGGGMNFEVNEKNFCYLDGVAKFEGGTPNIAGMYGLIKAIDFLNEIGYSNIHKYEVQIFNWLYLGLRDISHLEVYNWDCHSSTLTFNVKGVFCQDLAAYLAKHNIIVRSGLSCAKLMDNIIDTDGAVRASFYVYNTKEEIDYFISVLKKATKERVMYELI